MKRRFLIIAAVLVGLFSTTSAQTELDALRLSQLFYGSTARSMSMGGAFTALGGDFATLGLNPGGIGIYRAGEFSITPVFNFQKSESIYMGTPGDDFKYSFTVDNLGFVGVLNSGNDRGWISTNFGVGFNKLNNFNRNVVMQGVNDFASMSDYFLYWADGTFPENLDPYWERLAFDTYIIDTISFPNFYETYVPLGTTQVQTLNTSGGINEWSFTLGGNYDNKLFLGASLGIITVRYVERSSHTETDVADYNDFQQFVFNRRVSTKGTGFSFKLGAIYRPIQALRLGASVHLPIFYSLTDEESSSMKSWFDTGEYYSAVPTTSTGNPMGRRIKEFGLSTPLRFNTGAALILGRLGLVSLDYELVDYSTIRLRETDGGDSFTGTNNLMSDVYRPIHNLRIGGELKLNNIAFRGGYGLYQSPYASGQMNDNSSYSVLSAGFGIRESNFFLDFGYAMSSLEERFYPFYFEGMPIGSLPSENTYNNNSFKVTFGFRF